MFVVCLFSNFSHMIGPKELIFSGFDRDHPGDAIGKFGENWFVQQPLPDD